MIRPAELSWRDGQPYSAEFGDIYHAADGVAEVERVFLAPAAFDALLDQPRLLVGELGFGTGLNFAVIAERCIRRHTPLHFVSFEAAPIGPDDFRQLAAGRQRSAPVYAALAAAYPPLLSGWHQRRLAGGQITLSVFFGDAGQGLRQLADQQQRPFDLWLLDGFAPDRNPGMWTADLYARIAALSRRDTAVTTFTAAGRVRRGLADQGFAMRRVDQRPHKRESLAGHLDGDGLGPFRQPERVHVVGAGLAGASLARQLAESGVDVLVSEAAVGPAAGASGVPVTVMHPRLLAEGSAAALRAHAYAFASAACAGWIAAGDPTLVASGALQLPSRTYPPERLAAVAARYLDSGLGVRMVDPAEAERLTGVAVDQPGLWFADACTLATPEFCRRQLDHPRIELRTGAWLEGWPEGPTVLACGAGARAFDGASYLELAAVSGQLDLALRSTGSGPDAATELRAPLVGNGYLAPDPGNPNRLALGATYEYTPWPAERATEANLANARQLGLRLQSAGCHKAVRSVSSDRTAIAGPLYDPDDQPVAGRYVSTGHGSMGTVTSHYCASLIRARLLGDFAPLTPALEAALSPLRFRLRQRRRGYRFGATR